MLAVDYPTPVGPAHLAVDLPARPRGLLVLGHGAGGDIDAPDLLAVRDAALRCDHAVARLRQPYRVAGRRAAAPAAQLDVAYEAAVSALCARPELVGLPLLVGGRSSGARVAARGARALGARRLLTLAFPLVPPGRPGVTRIGELTAAGVPGCCVQGARDGFGSAADLVTALGAAPGFAVVPIADADHSFRTRRGDPTTTAQALAAVAAAVTAWLAGD